MSGSQNPASYSLAIVILFEDGSDRLRDGQHTSGRFKRTFLLINYERGYIFIIIVSNMIHNINTAYRYDEIIAESMVANKIGFRNVYLLKALELCGINKQRRNRYGKEYRTVILGKFQTVHSL